jgi:hypothetical protein
MADGETSTGGEFSGREHKDFEGNIKSKPTWIRFLYMLVFLVVGNLVGLIALIVIGLNFLIALITGEPNTRLKQTGATIAAYLAEIVLFLSYNTETKPFPFDSELPNP